MSSNNQLVIKKERKKYVVTEIDVDTQRGHNIFEEDELETAIRKANEYMQGEGWPIEYGLRIDI